VSALGVPKPRRRRPTTTSSFGSSRRESHDASPFYRRFSAPELSDDDEVQRPSRLDVVYRRDARDMGNLESGSIALVVTSPPYFAGKEYEASLGEGGIPGTYLEYLELLRSVFAECKRVLEPGGRIAVNVANLGRRPYRSLSGDVADILSELGMLLRGEVVWWKGRAAGGSCAWGTFRQPSNPVLRDVTERIVIASKGRFDRAIGPAGRRHRGLPSVSTVTRDEFLEATTDLWEIPPERASRVGHPAPFPVELPMRVIELFTYAGDVVLDPFMGSGTTAVAALRTGRHYIGYETDPSYVVRARARIAKELARPRPPRRTLGVSPVSHPFEGNFEAFLRALEGGSGAREVAAALLSACGFVDLRHDVRLPGLGLELPLVAFDRTGSQWAFEVAGAITSSAVGLKRADTLWRTLGRAAAVHNHQPWLPLVVLTTDLPAKGSVGERALGALLGPDRPLRDVVDLYDPEGHRRLQEYAGQGARS
jgi:DNA modification methylase